MLASSRIPKSTEEYSENVAAPWIKNLQMSWRHQLLQERLVETDNGTELLENLSVPSFTPGSVKEDNEAFYNLLHGQYFGRGVLPAFKYLHGWLDIVRPEYETWGTNLKYEKDDFLKDLSDVQNLNALASKIDKTREETIEWLNKVYKFIVDQNMLNEFDNYAIIPNQNGEFKYLKDLYSDYTSRIPNVLKTIYNSVNQEDETIQHMLVDADIEATIFGNNLRPFSLKEMIDELNEYIKSGSNININGSIIDVSSTVAYNILSLYPDTNDDSIRETRKSIYEFCSSYRKMSDYSMVDTAEFDLWKEADNYWFNNSYSDIVDKETISSVASSFFISPKSPEETLDWLNDYLKFYRDHSHGDLIKEQAVFPNQQCYLKKLGELRYDNKIPEVFKDLAKYAATPFAPTDVYRHQLLHRSILGYDQHNPLSTKDIYEYVKKKFDESNNCTKEVIARHTITILVKPETGEPEEKKLYDFAKTVSGNQFDEVKYIESGTGFNWGFAQEFYLKLICKKIADSVDIRGFKELSPSFTEMNEEELTKWIDKLIDFLHNFKSQKYWTIITSRDNGIGIWLNQNNNFCRFQDVRKDDNIPEELKDITANNKHLDYDYRESLFTLNSECSSYLETDAITLKEIGEFVDLKLKEYGGDKQDNDFRSLVFEIGKLCNIIPGLEDIMAYYKENKNSLIVGSLGKGTTMDFVGAIVRQGDEKIQAVKDILEGNTVEDLQNMKSILQGCSGDKYDKVKDFIEKMNHGQVNNSTETPVGGEDKTDILIKTVPKTFELEVIDFEGNTQIVKADQAQYAGLSLEEIENYVGEAKGAVVKYFRELNERNNFGLQFDMERIGSHSYSQLYGIYDKNGKEIPLVVHSYKGPQYRYFDLNWYDWQLLSQPGAMLWILTVTGLQCIPLYALPVRGFNFTLDNEQSNIERTALLTLAAVGRQYSQLSFDFGNNMPTGFKEPIRFDYVPPKLNNFITSIKKICDENLPNVANLYNSGKNIPIISSSVGYSRAMKEYEENGTMREQFDAPANDTEVPSVGTDYFD